MIARGRASMLMDGLKSGLPVRSGVAAMMNMCQGICEIKCRSHFQRFFLRGLAVVLPATLTLWVLVQAYLWIDRSIAQPINKFIQYVIVQIYSGGLRSDLVRVVPQRQDGRLRAASNIPRGTSPRI